MYKILAILTVCLLGVSSTGSAAIIADYRFSSGSAVSSASEANSTPANFVAAGNAGLSSSGNAFLRSQFTGATQVDALADADNFSFTVTAALGFVLNLTSVEFKLGGTTGALSVDSFTTNSNLQSSVGGLGTGGSVLGTASNAVPKNLASPVYVNASVDLTGPEYQGLSAITFRISIHDDYDLPSPTAITRIDDVVLNGTVAAAVVPEPSSFLLMACCAAGLGLYSQRRRR